jgi:hypothetical protein
MVPFQETVERVKDFYTFDKQEIFGLLIATIVIGFVFSFRHWGEEQFNLMYGLKNLVIATIIAGFSLWFRISAQKVYGFTSGQSNTYKVWWNGIVIMLVIAFLTRGWVPLVLVGGAISSFMVKQRLGEFRYGFSTWVLAISAAWSIWAPLILAALSAVGAYFFPQSLFFDIGMKMNLMMAFCSWLPLPQQDGLSLFFGSKGLWYLAILAILSASVLLLTKTTIGLIVVLLAATLIGIAVILTGSEK